MRQKNVLTKNGIALIIDLAKMFNLDDVVFDLLAVVSCWYFFRLIVSIRSGWLQTQYSWIFTFHIFD